MVPNGSDRKPIAAASLSQVAEQMRVATLRLREQVVSLNLIMHAEQAKGGHRAKSDTK